MMGNRIFLLVIGVLCVSVLLGTFSIGSVAPVEGSLRPKDTFREEVKGLDQVVEVASVQELVSNAAESAAEVIQWEGLDKMNDVIMRYWAGNMFCEEMRERTVPSTPQSPTLVNITFGCGDLYTKARVGTGNFISLIYSMRLAARAFGNLDVAMTCFDAEATMDALILPWLMGWFPESSRPTNGAVVPELDSACTGYKYNPTGYMIREMKYDLRRMAIGLVGIPSPDHPSYQFAKRYLWTDNSPDREFRQLADPTEGEEPLYPDVELDDVIIHFRCGDLMNSNHPSFAFMKFNDFARHISPGAQSIGIVTQPFEAKGMQQRREDANQGGRCKIVVHAFVDYLQERHPSAKIRIHNNADETLSLTYARMIMANQTIAGISSFGVFGPIANFGTGYVRKPDYPKAPNRWLLNFLEDERLHESSRDVVLFEAPVRLAVARVKSYWNNDPTGATLVEWFRNETLVGR